MPAQPDQRIANMDVEMALPRQNGELVFAEPWEARAFGIAVALNEAGVYPWRAFSQELAAEIAAAEQHGRPTSYYERWLATLARLAIAQGLVTPEELAARTAEYASGAHDEHEDQ
jgi:nitrile hydratase accessory protein